MSGHQTLEVSRNWSYGQNNCLLRNIFIHNYFGFLTWRLSFNRADPLENTYIHLLQMIHSLNFFSSNSLPPLTFLMVLRADWKTQWCYELWTCAIIRTIRVVSKFSGTVFHCHVDANNFKNIFDHFGGQNHQF